MSWFSRCSWCGGPFNSGNCRHCTNVSFGDEPIYDSNPNSYNQTPDFSNPLPHHNYETDSRSDTGAAFQAEFAKLQQNFERFMAQQSCSYCGGPFNGGNYPSCSIVRAENEFVHDPNPFPYDNTPDFYDQPPQHHVETYSYELCGNDSHYGYDCPPRFPLVYEQEPFDQPPQYSIDHPQEDLNQQRMNDDEWINDVMIESRNELFKTMQSLFGMFREQVSLLELDRFEILLGEREEGQVSVSHFDIVKVIIVAVVGVTIVVVIIVAVAVVVESSSVVKLSYGKICLPSSGPQFRDNILYQKLLEFNPDTMVDVNVNAPAEQAPAMAPPTRTNDQILPRNSWVPVGKRNCYLDVERSQSNPIYKIVDTVRYVKNTESYSCQLDEQWFDLTKYTLRDALQITPVDNNNPFSSPSTPDALINFVNELGYPKVTLAFERPRAPVLQILWGVVNRAHIDYAERMWEEFTQSIHSFVEDKKNLALHTQGKKKANPIVIPSIRFTKLIIHHLQSKHKFHPRPDSPLHLPYEEYVLGYLKFSAKGTKREVFGMPIPNNLITADIQGEQYYNAYLEKVAKHQRYLAGEEVSDPDSPAPKPAKATKPKATKQSKPLAPKAAPVTKPAAAKALKPTASQPPKPTPATTEPSKKDQSKKRKLVKESSEAPSPAKRPKAGKVIKKRTQKSSLQLVDEFVDEGVPVNEPRFGDEEADMQMAVEESLKDVHAAHQGPLPPVVIREPESGKFQPLPEVQGKGKEKVGEEQAAQVLLNLLTPKKKSPADQFIFQRRTPPPTEPSGHEESSSLYAELGLTDSETESDDDVSPEINPEAQDEGQAGPNPGKQVEGQAGSNPGDDAESQPQSSHVVHAGPNLEHMDFEATNASNQQNPEQMDEGFIATAYPKVQENLKLMVEEQVVLEEPASSTWTLSSLQHLTKDLSFGNQFFNDKPSDVENEKTTAETKSKSMVSVTIHQDTFAIPPMTSLVIDLISRPDSPNEHRPLSVITTATTTTTSITTLPLPPQPQQSTTDSILIKRIGELEQHMTDLIQDNLALEERMDKHGSKLYKLENLDIPHQVSKVVDEIVTDAVDWAIQAPPRDRFKDLPEADMKEILHHRIWETNSYKAHDDHKKLYEALEKSMDCDYSDQLLTDLAEARRNKKKRHDSPKTPPGSSQLPPPHPPLSINQSDQSKSIAFPRSSKTDALAEYTAWTTTDIRLKPSISSIPEDLHMEDDTAPNEQVHSSDDEDIGNDHIPKVNLTQDWWKPLSKEDRPATPKPAWSIPSSDLPV
ncbi:retrovirus-related pol polyprotein from transposon TNT 1-94 [Tanacetum coccineum]